MITTGFKSNIIKSPIRCSLIYTNWRGCGLAPGVLLQATPRYTIRALSASYQNLRNHISVSDLFDARKHSSFMLTHLKSRRGINTAQEPKAATELTQYRPPTTGVLSRLPASWVPYAQLMRIEKTGGLYAFYSSYLIGMGWATLISPTYIPPTQIFYVGGVLLIWTIWERGAVCTINDVLDRDFDRQVERCRLRPVARGAVTPTQGCIWYGVQCAVAASTVALLPHTYQCFSHAVPIVFGLSVYPLFKRWTDFPQLVLCVPLAWAIVMSCAALGVDPFTSQSAIMAAATASIVASNMTWMITIDYVNACQDTSHDIKAGVRSMAVRYENTAAFIATMGTIQVSLLATAGVLAGLGPVYFVGACGGNALIFALMARTVERKRPDICAWWFLRGSLLACWTLALALFAEYVTRDLEKSEDQLKIQSENL